MIRRPPRSTQSRSSAASDVYKRQPQQPGRAGDLDNPGRGGHLVVPRLRYPDHEASPDSRFDPGPAAQRGGGRMSRGSRAEGGTTDPGSESRGILSDSAVMAAGTVVSRASGFVRSALLAAALGAYLHADLFNIANTIPNMLYILLAGGVFNAVLVPQLVRAMKNDADGGEAYTNRIITLAGLFLAGVTAVLVVAA